LDLPSEAEPAEKRPQGFLQRHPAPILIYELPAMNLPTEPVPASANKYGGHAMTVPKRPCADDGKAWADKEKSSPRSSSGEDSKTAPPGCFSSVADR